MVRRGANVKAVQQQLGHSTPMVTLGTYTHLSPDLDQVMEALDAGHREPACGPSAPM
jgi:integrase